MYELMLTVSHHNQVFFIVSLRIPSLTNSLLLLKFLMCCISFYLDEDLYKRRCFSWCFQSFFIGIYYFHCDLVITIIFSIQFSVNRIIYYHILQHKAKKFQVSYLKNRILSLQESLEFIYTLPEKRNTNNYIVSL